MKGELVTTPAVIDDGVASTYVESFAIKIFGQADKEDRSGRATRYAALRFHIVMASDSYYATAQVDGKEVLGICQFLGFIIHLRRPGRGRTSSPSII